MKLTKSHIKEIIKEVLEEEIDEMEEDEVEEGKIGAALGALLAKRRGGPGQPDFGVEDVLKMGAGGYFGHKVQDYINRNPGSGRREDDKK